MIPLSHAEVRAMVLETIKKGTSNQVVNVATEVQALATRGGRLPQHYHSQHIRVPVEDVLWELFREGILYPGLGDGINNGWPWFHLSAHGKEVVKAGSPQPYDPDGFIKAFRAQNPTADIIILEYLIEAVQCLRSGTHRAATVMLGAASEQAVLLLVNQFEAAITDSNKKHKFAKDKGNSVYRNFIALQERLELMQGTRKFPLDLSESISGDLRGIFDLLRRARNEAGHPAITCSVDADSLFLNLRVFPQYVERLYRFIEYFAKNPADW